MANYEIDVVAKAIEHVYGPYFGDNESALLRKEAAELVGFMHDAGYRLTREDTGAEYVSQGPIQRALGIDGGDGF